MVDENTCTVVRRAGSPRRHLEMLLAVFANDIELANICMTALAVLGIKRDMYDKH